jgi:hypothetical protein
VSEQERIARYEIEIPVYGTEEHVRKTGERLQSIVALHFQNPKITNIEEVSDQEPS